MPWHAGNDTCTGFHYRGKGYLPSPTVANNSPDFTSNEIDLDNRLHYVLSANHSFFHFLLDEPDKEGFYSLERILAFDYVIMPQTRQDDQFHIDASVL